MTIEKAIKTIDALILKKKEILKAERKLLKTVGNNPRKNSIKATLNAVVSATQYDVKMLQSIKRQLKSKPRKIRKEK